ncbi:uncharacterized protein LOC124818674 [Hydra vulgaris]|uniref:uncharacterized protein LOC124818674 n=1 Tax=Hydra vulgaris TaxID=6087 RepID=UPI001F5F3EA9|nr:uncharacterized protein LOC124818674 [Hydra vulgaris]
MFLLYILCWLLDIAGIGLALFSAVKDDWQVNKIDKSHCGIWTCNYGESYWFTKILITVGCMTYILAFGLNVFTYLKKVENHRLSIYMLILTALCLTAAFAVFTNEIFRFNYYSQQFRFGVAYKCGIGSVPASITSAVLQFFIIKSEFKNI